MSAACTTGRGSTTSSTGNHEELGTTSGTHPLWQQRSAFRDERIESWPVCPVVGLEAFV